jgi:acetyl esterase/lipase
MLEVAAAVRWFINCLPKRLSRPPPVSKQVKRARPGCVAGSIDAKPRFPLLLVLILVARQAPPPRGRHPGAADVLRDEGEAYARRLSGAGVPVTAVRYLGTIHAFTVLNALAETPAARAAIAQANSVLRNVFAK